MHYVSQLMLQVAAVTLSDESLDGAQQGNEFSHDSGAWLLREVSTRSAHQSPAKFAAAAITVALFGCIVAILRHRGPRVCMVALLYILHLVVIALAVRQLTRPPLNYAFPALVSLLHYVFTWIVVALYWIIKREPNKIFPSSVGPATNYLRKIVPISLALPISIILNNKSLIFIGAGLCAVVGTLSPLVTAIISRMLGRRLTCVSWFGVLVAFGGALLIGVIEACQIRAAHKHNGVAADRALRGLVFALVALGLRSIRIVLQDTLTSPLAYRPLSCRSQTESQQVALSGMHLLAAQSPAVVLVSFVFTMCTENLAHAWRQMTLSVFAMLMLTCAVATLLNILGVVLLSDVGSTLMQVIGKLNAIVTMSVSIAFFGEQVAVGVLIGSGIILFGVAVFEKGERTERAEAAEKVRWTAENLKKFLHASACRQGKG